MLVRYTTSCSCNTQPGAPEDGRNNRPKHVELIGIINKPLLLHLVGCLYYLYNLIFDICCDNIEESKGVKLVCGHFTYFIFGAKTCNRS